MNYWETIADNLQKRGWSLGYVSAVDSNGRTIWIADAHRGDGKRFVARADEKLTAFAELEAAIRTGSNIPVSLGCPTQPSPISANLLLDYANQWFALWCFTPTCC
ncbi:MAG TPA: hypothetical protein VGM65_15230 [Candidatus Udaeobacter sp.]